MSPGVPVVTVREASDRPADAVLLDVREDDEWRAGHAPGAVHIPMHQVAPDTLPPGRPIYCICRSGNRSGRVAEMLAAARVDAYNVVGGMVAWQGAGLPVVT